MSVWGNAKSKVSISPPYSVLRIEWLPSSVAGMYFDSDSTRTYMYGRARILN